MFYAVNTLKADVLMEFDADFSHDPEKIPAFLTAIDQGSDLVLGSRYIKGGTIPKNWGWHRKFLSVGGNLFIRVIMAHFAIHDWTTGYRAIRKEVYEAVKPLLNRERFFGYTFQIAFLFHALRKGFTISEVPIHFIDRTRGVSKIGPEYIKNNLLFIFKTRLGEIMHSRIFKFAFVGGVGAMVQLVSANLYAGVMDQSIKIASLVLSLPDFLAIESAVISNFIFNNIWTFSDKKLKPAQYLPKFIQFNLASFGSIAIQTLVIGLGLGVFGVKYLFTLPLISIAINSRTVYHVTGIMIGMFWNFFAYTKFIWRTK
jgi:dolichol-phosphate mannosyltransferase